jgi:prefoldin subunit 5
MKHLLLLLLLYISLPLIASPLDKGKKAQKVSKKVYKKQFKRLSNNFNSVNNDNLKLLKERDTLRNQIADCQQQLQQCMAECDCNCEKLNRELQILKGRVANLNNKVKSLGVNIKHVRDSTNSVIGRKNSKIAEQKNYIQIQNSLIKDKDTQIYWLNDSIDRFKKQLVGLRKDTGDLKKKNEVLTTANKKLNKITGVNPKHLVRYKDKYYKKKEILLEIDYQDKADSTWIKLSDSLKSDLCDIAIFLKDNKNYNLIIKGPIGYRDDRKIIAGLNSNEILPDSIHVDYPRTLIKDLKQNCSNIDPVRIKPKLSKKATFAYNDNNENTHKWVVQIYFVRRWPLLFFWKW